jgi:hypothetical protein
MMPPSPKQKTRERFLRLEQKTRELEALLRATIEKVLALETELRELKRG